jgi:glycosyltransferase involved in cell wall biosynthesis
MVRIIVEGWRFLPHSYAIFNQFQCLEMLKRPEVELFHKDSRYFREDWQPVTGLFDAAAEAALQEIPSPYPNLEADATLRIDFPYNFEPSHAKRTCVFATSEFWVIPEGAIRGNISLQDAHRNSDVVIVTSSNWSREGFIRNGADPDRVVVVPLGADTSIYKPIAEAERTALRRKLGFDGFVFLHIGGMSGNKGIQLLLKAFAAITESHPSAKLVLKGLNSLYNSETLLVKSIQELAGSEAKKILNRLTYIGQSMSFSEMAQLYQAADAYLSPYLGEGFNLPVLEAAACGLPVICTKGGSTDDFTTPDFALHIESEFQSFQTAQGTTCFARVPDLEHLILLMQAVMQRDDFREKAHYAGPSFVASRLTWKHIVDQLLDVLVPNV